MSNLVRWARRGSRSVEPISPWPAITIDQMLGQFGYLGLGYGPGTIQGSLQQPRETIEATFTGIINGAYKSNGAVFACVLTRMMIFSEAHFQFRQRRRGRPGALFGTDELLILEEPWPNATTGDLLRRALLDVDTSGNFYATKVPRQDGKGMRLARLRPDWITIILGSYRKDTSGQFDPFAELVGYVFEPGGPGSGEDPMFFLPEEVMHWAPIPDPAATYRGMSWIQPVIAEVLGDRVMTTHKTMYFENGATPNLVVSMDTGKMNRATFEEWISTFEDQHAGAINAYKTLYLGMGAEAKTIGSNLKDLEYAVVQGHGETRISAAAGVPAIIVGFSEGLESATYSNFAQARRAFSDKTLRPLWRDFAGSASVLVNVPGGSELWYDDRDIGFLQEDQKDLADQQLTKATAMKQLTDAGYTPESVVKAIEANDMTLLEHSGLFSVQLRPPNSGDPNQPSQGGQNGNGNGASAGTNGNNGQSSLGSAGRRVRMAGSSEPFEELAKALAAMANRN